MFPFRNILFPTDFSAHSHAALKYAAGFARDGNGRQVGLFQSAGDAAFCERQNPDIQFAEISGDEGPTVDVIPRSS